MPNTYAEAEAEIMGTARYSLTECLILSDTGWNRKTVGRCYVTGSRAITIRTQDLRVAQLIGEWFTKGPLAPMGQSCAYTVSEIETITETRRDQDYPFHRHQYTFQIYRIDMSYECDSGD